MSALLKAGGVRAEFAPCNYRMPFGSLPFAVFHPRALRRNGEASIRLASPRLLGFRLVACEAHKLYGIQIHWCLLMFCPSEVRLGCGPAVSYWRFYCAPRANASSKIGYYEGADYYGAVPRYPRSADEKPPRSEMNCLAALTSSARRTVRRTWAMIASGRTPWLM